MNDQTLHSLLGKLVVPPSDDAAREKARHRAGIAFANRHAAAVPAQEGTRWMKILSFGLAGVGVILICLCWLQGVRPAGEESFSGGKLLAEMEALFPGQLDGVICSEGKVSLDLAPEASEVKSGPSQPLALTLQRGRQRVEVLGYSGRKVCVSLGGRKRCLEPLVTGEGKVIVAGDDFLWTNAHPIPVAGYRLEARTLSL
jgi:hypothetical protein